MPRTKKPAARKTAAKKPAAGKSALNNFQKMVDDREEGEEYAVNLENVNMCFDEALEELESAVIPELLDTQHGRAVIVAINEARAAVEAWQKALHPDGDYDD